MTMEVVLDTVCLRNLLRRPKRGRGQGASPGIGTSIDQYVISGRLTLCLDAAGGLLDEWRTTCGFDPVQVLITKWERGIRVLADPPPLDGLTRTRLGQLGFPSGIDRLILRMAVCTHDKTVVSNDPHFWNPGRPRDRGKDHAPVARYCHNRLGVTIWLLIMLMNALSD